jgi:predicted nucleic acid-binding protein
MNPPSYLLDLSFLIALADSNDDKHDDAKAIYTALVDDFVEQRCLLVARADHLEAVESPDLFAAIDKLHIARQHRSAAADLVERSGVGLEDAITMVLIHRCRIRKVATFNEALARYDIELISAPPTDAPNFVAGDDLGVSATTKLEPEAG